MRVHTIFNSIDGEVNSYYQGAFSTFVRLAGCNLRCHYCDTRYAQEMEKGEEKDIGEIVELVKGWGCPKLTITGGEPLMQKTELGEFIFALKEKAGFIITIETNGSMPIDTNWPVYWVVDYKCPSAGVHAHASMKDEHFAVLTPYDFVKFVLGNREDYEFAREKVRDLSNLGCKAKFAFSTHTMLLPKEIIRWMQHDQLFQVIVNVQLHKLIGVA